MTIGPKVIIQIDLSKDLDLYDWLKCLVQNPIYEDESDKEKEYREKLFKVLNIVTTTKISPIRTVMREAKAEQDRMQKLYEEDDIPF